MKSLGIALFFLAPFFTACAGPMGATSKYMEEVEALPERPDPGKSLVYFHRPRRHTGHPLYFSVWEKDRLLGVLGNGHSTAIMFEPGPRTFVGRSTEVKTVVDAQLEPDQIYDFTTRNGGFFIASFHLVPVRQGDEARADIPAWLAEHKKVRVPSPPPPKTAAFIEETLPKIDEILVNFRRDDRVKVLEASDHRASP